jgi:hypothetical protein
MGSLPGCMGTFAVVTLFTHRVVKFGSLIAVSLATFGDEAFIFFGTDPINALILTGILASIAIVTGIAFTLFEKNAPLDKNYPHFQTHKDDCHCKPVEGKFKLQLQKISISRAFLIAILLLIILSQFLGGGHAEATEHIHNEVVEHEHETVLNAHAHGLLSPETLVFIIVGIVILFIVLTVPEHFLTEHVWSHVLKKHFLPIFLWTFASIFLIQLLLSFYDPAHWIEENMNIVFLTAILIGLIPISGPHLIFISLFTGGLIPFSVLLINAVVQEGHGGLPLLAESKKDFFKMKAIKIGIALIIALAAYFFKF